MKTKIVYTFLPLVLLMLVLGCSKKDDVVAPDLATTVAGTYQVTTLTVGGKTTTTTPSANNTVILSRTSTNVVSLELKVSGSFITPDIKLSGTADNISLKGTYSNGALSGSIINGTLVYASAFTDGTPSTSVIAKK